MIRSLPLAVLILRIYKLVLGLSLPGFRFMPLNNPDRRGKETELVSQAILQMTHKRKMQTGFAARGENDERRRPYANLRDVLHMQARTFVSLGRGNTRSLSDFSFKEFIQTRRGNAHVAGLVGFHRQRQKFLHALSAQR